MATELGTTAKSPDLPFVAERLHLSRENYFAWVAEQNGRRFERTSGQVVAMVAERGARLRV